uniref:IS110 family transposase n=1 Tax=Alcaligenes faecalis TaxID=511 RepID=A0A1Z3ML01_ALCFA|nr:IS110 family transposase [Alcaligenes faecalis]
MRCDPGGGSLRGHPSGAGQKRAAATGAAAAQNARGLEEDPRPAHQPAARHPARDGRGRAQRHPGVPASGLRADRASGSLRLARRAAGTVGRDQSLRTIDARVRGAAGALACRRRDRAQARRGQRHRAAHRQRPENGCRHARTLRQRPASERLAGHDTQRIQQRRAPQARPHQLQGQCLRANAADPRRPRGVAGRQALPGTYAATPDPAAALGPADGRTHRPQQGCRGPGEQTGEDLLGGVVPRTPLQWRLAECKARLTAG